LPEYELQLTFQIFHPCFSQPSIMTGFQVCILARGSSRQDLLPSGWMPPSLDHKRMIPPRTGAGSSNMLQQIAFSHGPDRDL
jgi:hypothetical protein